MYKNRPSLKLSLKLSATALVAVGSLLVFGILHPLNGQAAAGINQQLNFQGRLLDNTGAVVADGTYNMEFKIYQDGTGCVAGGTSPCGGTLKWTEDWIQTNRVTVKNGYFSVNLGSINAFGSQVDWNQSGLWLSTNIGGVTNTPTPTWDGEMTPFKRMAASPYALDSNSLQGLQASSFVQLANGLQTDTSAVNPSIFINKTNLSGTPNILELQKAGADVLAVSNNGSLAVTPTVAAGTISLGATAQTGTITVGQFNGTGTSVVNIGANAGAASTQQINIGTSTLGISTVAIGSASSSSSTNISGGSGGIKLTPSGTGNSGVLVKPAAGSAAAFQIQDTNNNAVFTANTANGNTSLGVGNLLVNGATLAAAPNLAGSTTGGSLSNATTYYYLVAAVNSSGAEGFDYPSNPDHYLTTNATSSTTLTWTVATGANSYKIYRSTDNTNWKVINVGNVLTYTDTSNAAWTTSGTRQDFSQSGNIDLQAGAGIELNPAFTQFIQYAASINALEIANLQAGSGVSVYSDSLKFVDSTGFNTDFSISNAGAVLFKNRTDSTTSFQVQSSGSATPIFNIDTQNGKVGIGTATTDDYLTIAPPSNTRASLGLKSSGGAGAEIDFGESSAYQGSLNFNRSVSDGFELTVGGTSTGTPQTGGNTVFSESSTGQALFQNSADSTSAFQIQTSTGGDKLLTADTASNKIVVGDATGTNAGTTQFIVDSSTVDPSTGSDGSIYYNSTDDKFRCYQGGAWADCLGATSNSTLSMVSGLANVAANTGGQAVETLVFTSATAVSNTAGATGFTAAAGGSFRTCLVKNNANITAGTLDLRWRVNGVSVGSAICSMDNTAALRRQASGALDAGVVKFSQGDTIGIAFDTNAAFAPATDDYTVYWTIEYNSTLTNAGATLQSAYDNSNTLTTSDAHDLHVSAADTATDANVLFDLQCVAACGSNGRFAVQNNGADVLSVAPNSGNISLAPAGAGDIVAVGDNDSNFQINSTFTGTGSSQAALAVTLTDNATAAGTSYGLNVTNADNGANTGVPAALAHLANANAGDTVPDGLQIEQTGGGTLTNGLEIKRTAGTVTNGLSFSGAIGTDIRLQNSESISNNTNGTINLAADSGALNLLLSGSSATVTNTSGGLTIDAASGQQLSLGTGANAHNTVIGNNSGASGLSFISGTGAQAHVSSVTNGASTAGAFVFTDSSIGTTGDFIYLNPTSNTLTTGSLISNNGVSYAHTANETGILAGLTFTDATNTTNTTTTTGLNIASALNLGAGASSGTKTVKGVSVAAPTLTSCTAGSTCVWDGLDVSTQAAGAGSNLTQNGLNIVGAGIASGNLNGINIAAITGGAGTETALSIGAGWDEAIQANGIVTIGAQANTATTGTATYSLTNEAAGTYGATGADTARDRVASSVVYEGKLFISTSETNLAGVYRYDGGTHPWTLVTSTTLGKAISTDSAADADAFVMTVFAGKLWIGSQTGSGTGAIYYSTNADTASAGNNFTMVNSARGTINGTAQNGISDMTVFNGNLIVATQKTNAAEIDRYDGGTTFTRITATVGKSVAETTADKDSFNLNVCNNYLFSGSVSGSTTGIVAAYAGSGTTWLHLTGTTGGGAFGAETATSDIDSMACYDSSLFIATSKTAGNAAAIYYYKPSVPVANIAANFIRINVAVGKMQNADTAIIDHFILRGYKGRLYAGSQTATGDSAGALFEYSGIPLADWPLMTTGARGTFGSQTGIANISMLQEYNGTLYVGTDDFTSGTGSVYTWDKLDENSYALQFDSGGGNYGAISFVGDQQGADNNGHYGSFIFSNSLMLASAAYDYAEDYPTFDSSLVAGDPVSVDPQGGADHVRLAKPGDTILGVVSANPGMTLSTNVPLTSGDRYVPIALVGRVPSNVTTNGGQTPIEAGDKLSLSNTPGLLQKSTSAGEVVGTALESYGSASDGTIDVFINPGWDGNFITLGQIGNQSSAGININLGDSQTLNLLDSNGQQLVSFDSQGNATFKGTVTADKIVANQIEGLEVITDKISSLSDELAKQQAADTTTVKTGLSASGGGKVSFTTVSAVNLTVLAQIETKGGLIVDGDAQFNGKTLFQLAAEFDGPVNINGQVTYNSDAGGTAIIHDGDQKVTVKFSKEYTTKPIIIANWLLNDTKDSQGNITDSSDAKQQRLLDGGYSYSVANITTKGFDIILNKKASEDVDLSWIANAVKNAQISQSNSGSSL